MINVCLFQRKYLCRQVNEAFTELILCRVYICKSAKQEDRGGGCSPPLILYIEKGEGKRGCLRGKDFLFMMVSILPISLFRRNNQGII